MILLLAACAPLIAGATPVPLPAGREGEIGFAAHGGHVPVHLQDGLQRRREYPTVGFTSYARFELDSGVGLGARIDVGPTQYLAAGGWLRYGLIRRSTAYLGVQAEAGWVYGELSIPVAFQASERIWLWSRPGARAALVPMGFLPLGITYDPRKSFAVHFEAMVMTPIFMTGWRSVNPVGATGSVGLSSRF
ncbi:MAG: hypothetical protein H6737_31475 [Alphaproteobacteria bacterium]|nr:hypothetical protein [Alphaproteobacteria bacterium]